jgi:hypothetical protein
MNETTAAAELFNAPTIEAPKPKTKKGKKHRLEIPMEGLDPVAALGVVEKALKAVSKQLVGEIKDRIVGIFLGQMTASGIKPDGFTAIGPLATGLCGLKKRGSNLSVDEATAIRLRAKGIHLDLIEKVPERLVINPEVLKDQAAIAAVAEAIKGHPALEGITVIMQQKAETRYAVSDETLPQLARSAGEFEDLREILGNVAIVTLGRFEFRGCSDSSDQKRKAIEILEEAGIL